MFGKKKTRRKTSVNAKIRKVNRGLKKVNKLARWLNKPHHFRKY